MVQNFTVLSYFFCFYVFCVIQLICQVTDFFFKCARMKQLFLIFTSFFQFCLSLYIPVSSYAFYLKLSCSLLIRWCSESPNGNSLPKDLRTSRLFDPAIQTTCKQNYKLLKVACSFARSFSTDTHHEKTSVWRKANKCVIIYSVG